MRKKASSCKVLGGVVPNPVTSLGAGGDKGETELRLPLRLFLGFVKFCSCCLAGLCLSLIHI